MNRITRLFLLIVFMAIGGCATMQEGEFLGISNSGKIIDGKYSPERIPQTVSMRLPGMFGDVDGYRVQTPIPWREKEFVCRAFRNIEEKEVEICRLVSRVIVNEQEYSAFIQESSWFFFVPKGTKVSLVQFPSSDGKNALLINPQPISKEKTLEVYEKIAEAFPFQSKPIDGVRILFGAKTLEAFSVPSLITLEERMAYCDVFSVSSTEIIGIAHGNPIAVLPKLLAAACSAMTTPNFLVKEEEKPIQTNEGIAFKGNQ